MAEFILNFVSLIYVLIALSMFIAPPLIVAPLDWNVQLSIRLRELGLDIFYLYEEWILIAPPLSEWMFLNVDPFTVISSTFSQLIAPPILVLTYVGSPLKVLPSILNFVFLK